MSRLRRRRLIGVLVAFLVTVLVLEGLLSLDPLGAIYRAEIFSLWSNSEHIPAGWAQRPGTYNFRHWSATIEQGNVRRVPDTNPDGAETWVFFGDSYGFGYAVNDEDTYVNRIAQALPDVHVINAGTSGYSSENIRLRMRDFPDADRLIYVIVGNDAEVSLEFSDPPEVIPPENAVRIPWISLYLEAVPVMLAVRSAGGPIGVEYDMERFQDDVRAMAADPRVTILGFTTDPLYHFAAECCNALPLAPVIEYPVSWMDGHPNAQGHAVIARHIMDALEIPS